MNEQCELLECNLLMPNADKGAVIIFITDNNASCLSKGEIAQIINNRTLRSSDVKGMSRHILIHITHSSIMS